MKNKLLSIFDDKLILKNSFFLLSSDIVNKGLLILIIILIGRIVGVENFGKFNLAYSIVLMSLVFIDFGLNIFTTKKLSGEKKNLSSIFSNLIFFKISISIFFALIFFITINLLNIDLDFLMLLIILFLYIFINSFQDFLIAFYRSIERMQYEFLIKLIQGFTMLITFILLYFNSNQSVYVLSLTFLTGTIISLIYNILFIYKKAKFPKLDFKYITLKSYKEIMKEVWPFALSTIFVTLYFRIDSLMIAYYLDNINLGIYSAALTIISGLFFIPGVLANSYFPRLSSYFKNNKKKINDLFKKFLIKVTIIVIPLTLILFLLSNFIINILYGNEFSDAIVIFQILLLTLFIKFYNFPYGFLLSAVNKQKIRLNIQFFTIFVNIVGNVILIPIYGILGAAMATILSELNLLIFYYIFSKREMKKF